MITSGLVIFGITILIIIILGLYEYRVNKTIPIPKRIWTYQDDENRSSKIQKMCIRSWKKYHPNYEIIVLTRKTVKGYVRIPEEILSHPSLQTDHFWELVCLYTLAEHGGIWMNPTILMSERMEDWLFPRKGEFSGFYYKQLSTSSGTPMLETSFLACDRGAPFITKWKQEYASIAHYLTIEKYVESRKNMGMDLTPFHDPIQQVMLVAAQKVLQLDQYPIDTLVLQSTEEGPLRYRMDTKGNVEKGLQLACMVPRYRYPILLLQKDGEKIMEQEMDHSLNNSRCNWLD